MEQSANIFIWYPAVSALTLPSPLPEDNISGKDAQQSNIKTTEPTFEQLVVPQKVAMSSRHVPDPTTGGSDQTSSPVGFTNPEAALSYRESPEVSTLGYSSSSWSQLSAQFAPMLVGFPGYYLTLPVDFEAERSALCTRIEQLSGYYDHLCVTLHHRGILPLAPPWLRPGVDVSQLLGDDGRRPGSFLEFLNIINNHRMWYEREVARLESLRVLSNDFDFRTVMGSVERGGHSPSLVGPVAQVEVPQ
jgi:hypothetical protein